MNFRHLVSSDIRILLVPQHPPKLLFLSQEGTSIDFLVSLTHTCSTIFQIHAGQSSQVHLMEGEATGWWWSLCSQWVGSVAHVVEGYVFSYL